MILIIENDNRHENYKLQSLAIAITARDWCIILNLRSYVKAI